MPRVGIMALLQEASSFLHEHTTLDYFRRDPPPAARARSEDRAIDHRGTLEIHPVRIPVTMIIPVARGVVAGFCVANDVSERAFQIERGGQWSKGKSSEKFLPLGPWIVTADEVPDPQRLGLTLDVNGLGSQRGECKHG